MGTNSISQVLPALPRVPQPPPKIPPQPSPAFTFEISSGRLLDAYGGLVTVGCWSGHGAGFNNPLMQAARGVGPLPAGTYRIGPLEDGGHLGPDCMRLVQLSGVSYGRSGFWIHGASSTHPATSSDGCLILMRQTRLQVDATGGASRILAVRV